MKTEQLNVSGMTCGGCVANVKRALSGVPGVNSVDVSLPEQTATVMFDEARTSADAMLAAVRLAGYDLVATPATTAGGCCGS